MSVFRAQKDTDLICPYFFRIFTKDSSEGSNPYFCTYVLRIIRKDFSEEKSRIFMFRINPYDCEKFSFLLRLGNGDGSLFPA